MAGTSGACNDLFVSINLSTDLINLNNTKDTTNESDADDESSYTKSFDYNDGTHGLKQQGLSLDEGLSLGSPNGDTIDATTNVEDFHTPVFDSDDEETKLNGFAKAINARQKFKLASLGSSNSTSSTNSDIDGETQSRKRSAVDGLLFEIYERYTTRENGRSIDSDNITECSTTSSSFCFASSLENDETRVKLDKAYLETKGIFITLFLFGRALMGRCVFSWGVLYAS